MPLSYSRKMCLLCCAIQNVHTVIVWHKCNTSYPSVLYLYSFPLYFFFILFVLTSPLLCSSSWAPSSPSIHILLRILYTCSCRFSIPYTYAPIPIPFSPLNFFLLNLFIAPIIFSLVISTIPNSLLEKDATNIQRATFQQYREK